LPGRERRGAGLGNKTDQRLLGSRSLIVARTNRSPGRHLGRRTFRCNTRNWCLRARTSAWSSACSRSRTLNKST